jgi:aspartyl protease family protein
MKQTAYFLFLLLALTHCGGCSKSGSRRPPRNRQPETTAQQSQPTTTDQTTTPQPTVTATDSVLDAGPTANEIAQASRPEPAPGGKTEIDMIEENGVYTVPVYVNGVPMTFIFDTGASDISMSATEAGFLYKQGKLTQEDVLGEAQFSDANGDISSGTVIKLRSVRLGNRTLTDVKASIVDNNRAPLLLGQSALARFGKISIDYQRKKIVFE